LAPLLHASWYAAPSSLHASWGVSEGLAAQRTRRTHVKAPLAMRLAQRPTTAPKYVPPLAYGSSAS
jgi:hypothetical protein